jgi:ribosomal protein L7/L12
MITVEINGWQKGFKKVSHTEALKSFAGLSLIEAKSLTDAVLDGKSVSVQLQTHDEAEKLLTALRSYGANASIKN